MENNKGMGAWVGFCVTWIAGQCCWEIRLATFGKSHVHLCSLNTQNEKLKKYFIKLNLHCPKRWIYHLSNLWHGFLAWTIRVLLFYYTAFASDDLSIPKQSHKDALLRHCFCSHQFTRYGYNLQEILFWGSVCAIIGLRGIVYDFGRMYSSFTARAFLSVYQIRSTII